MSKLKFNENAISDDLEALLPPNRRGTTPSGVAEVRNADGAAKAAESESQRVLVATAPPVQEEATRPVTARVAVPTPLPQPVPDEVEPTEEVRNRSRTKAAPKVKIDGDLFHWVGELQSRDAATNGKKRSHGRIALEMVQTYRDELSKKWKEVAKPTGDELFPGLDEATPGRKAQTDSMRDLYLSGPKPEHIERLDDLVQEWQCGSRRELINEALRLGFEADNEKSKKRARR